MYTQCPECNTIFRVQDEHLRPARGKVRCGQCMAVFNAAEHRIDQLPAEAATVAGERERPPTADEPPAVSPPSDEPLAEETPAPPDWQSADFSDVNIEALLKTPDGQELEQPSEYADERRAKEGLSEEELRLDDAVAEGTSAEAGGLSNMRAPAEDEPEGIFDTLEELVIQDEAPLRAAAPEPTSLDTEATSNEAEDYEPEPPLALTPERRRKSGVFSSLLWSVVILALLATLVLQYTYHNRDRLAERTALRPWVETLCDVAGCTLAPRRDLNAIDLVDRQVQSHPRYKGALLISATLVNRADFTQPYPVVEVVLEDLSGRKIASRRFKPNEYLVENPGKGFRPGAEAHLLLEVADPGQNAVSFKFNFH